ncbi:hypothetical protein GCK72_013930 [Caenorhabditis remanei]|uniref:Uncharacterized protein n=1 Tax=Caenorhabditis remanei TaxID=31234 RepID=A0A6A5GS42_CAERE|nr:hypothetical protein GCK72_013930 [Caenorhabditis remanei]KAF1757474.1 hypothetical protein GCK72_013930 [Caenorhabditis remanei]
MVELPQEALNRDRFISEFNAKPWDPTKREKCYIYEKEFANRLHNAMDCSEGLDFERHDGLLATINVIPSCGFLHFYVWHKRFNIA